LPIASRSGSAASGLGAETSPDSREGTLAASGSGELEGGTRLTAAAAAPAITSKPSSLFRFTAWIPAPVSQDASLHQSGQRRHAVVVARDVAAAGEYEFLLVVPPLKIRGGTGSALRSFALVP
jgi:hypothetical protein